MASIDERLQAVLNSKAQRYADELLRRAREVLSNAAYRVTDELLNSVHVYWLPASGVNGPKIIFEFAEHGIFLDQRSPKWVKLPSIENLQGWVEAKGVDSFTNVSGYKNSNNLSEFKKAERIAWAIAKDKRRNDTWKRKRWKRDVLRDMLLRLNTELLQAFTMETEKIIADSIKGVLTT